MTPQRIGSRYLLHERIGEGGTGTVWRAQDVEAGAWRAIKVLTSAYAPDPAAAARFVRERDALLAFRHPNVVTLHDVIVDGERLALVMDLLAEGDLDRLRRDRGGTLPADLAAELTAQVCDGLAAAHAAGIVHGDLKPSNVLMDAGRARITDFGIARKGRADGADTVTAAGMVTGTLGSMSPEALSGADPAPAGDVYAVGVTLYELLAGRQPGAGEAGTTTPGQMRNVPPRPDGIPEPLWRLILSCLEKNPDARPAAAALAEALRNPWLSVAPLAAPAAFGAGAGAGGLLPEPETVIAPGTKTAVPEPETVVPEPETVVPAWQQSWDEAFGRPWPGMTPARPAASPRTVTGFPPPGTGRPSGGGGRGSAKGLHRWGVAAAVAAAAVIVAGGGVGAYAAFGHPQNAASPTALPSLPARTASPADLAQSASPSSTGKPKASPAHGGSGSPASSSISAVPSTALATSAAAPTATAVPATRVATSAAAPTAVATSAAAPTAIATSAAAPTTTAAAPSSAAGCSPSPSPGTSFWRCNGTAWLPISCAVGENNGTNGPYNVLKASSQCSDRVWLHQYAYPKDEKSGWAYCISPKPAGAAVQTVPAEYTHPLNIQISSNPNNCL